MLHKFFAISENLATVFTHEEQFIRNPINAREKVEGFVAEIGN